MKRFVPIFLLLAMLGVMVPHGIVLAQTALPETTIPNDPEPPTGGVTVDKDGGIHAATTAGIVTTEAQLPDSYQINKYIAGKTLSNFDCSQVSDCSKWRVRVLLCKQDINAVKSCGDGNSLRGDQAAPTWNTHWSAQAPCANSSTIMYYFTKAQIQKQDNTGNWNTLAIDRSKKGYAYVNCTIN